MKRKFTLFAISLFLFVSQASAQDFSSAKVIQSVVDKLNSVKQLGYKYSFELSYPSQDRNIKDQAEAFIDLRPADSGARFRFQFAGAERLSAYNGTERFTLDKKGKKIYVESKPTFDSFGDIYLMNSPIALKYALPKITTDKSISKKVTAVSSGWRNVYVIEFGLPKGILTAEGKIVEIRQDHTNLYRLTVDTETLLPIEIVQSNDKNDESVRTTYSNMTERPAMPAASSWFYSGYLKDFALQKKDKLTLIKAGKPAPVFSLDRYFAGSKISLDQFKGNLTLVEFWIAHCGFCIAAVPKLNLISRQYRDNGLETISINMYDPPATIEAFSKKNKPEYPILTGGDSIAVAYGVESYPAFVLIDKSGNVVYSSSGLEEEKLAAAIVVNLTQ
ncbi:MAG: TlpA disulfide reductase family protein [bacterium]|nr:TlpA disulfide reductase family protein [bacterium]